MQNSRKGARLLEGPPSRLRPKIVMQNFRTVRKKGCGVKKKGTGRGIFWAQEKQNASNRRNSITQKQIEEIDRGDSKGVS